MTSINRRTFTAAGASVATAAMLGSAGATLAQAAGTPPSIGEDGSSEGAKAAGTISFGTSNDVPSAVMDNATGAVSGIDADLLSEIPRRLGDAGKTTVQVTFAGLVPGLLSRHFDVVADSMGITAKREEQIGSTRSIFASRRCFRCQVL